MTVEGGVLALSDGQFHDSHGNYIGSIRSNGEMYDEHGDFMGRIDSNGHLYDEHGDYVGAVWSNGYIYMNGSYVGQIWEDGQVYVNGSYAGRVSGFDMPGMTVNKDDITQTQGGGKKNSGGNSGNNPPKPPRSHINLPSPNDGDGVGCLIIGLLIVGALYVLLYVVVSAIVIGVFLAIIAGLIAVVGVIVFFIINAVKHGEFAKDPNAKKISGAIATGIVAVVFVIAYQGGFLEDYIGSPNSNTASTTPKVQDNDYESDYEDNESGPDEYDDESGNDYAEEDNSASNSSNDNSNDDYESEDEQYITEAAEEAEFGPVKYGNHTYAIFNYKDLGLYTWMDCEDYCEGHGGYMAVINDDEENTWLYNYIRSCDLRVAMFGYTNDDYYTNGPWTWVGGYSDYTNWADGQPNNGANSSSGDPEPYAEFYKDSSIGTWNDASFGANTWRFICEWD